MPPRTPFPPIRLPHPLQSRLEQTLLEHLQAGHANPGDSVQPDFSTPPGETALTPADSVSWRVFKNPIALFIGGITAVLLELAEPRVRSGVWDHTTFRTDPIKRMRRTGLAAMITVYGARSAAEPMIAGVRRMHSKVHGKTPDGVPYHANDPELLRWVHATAAFGFLQAYHTYVRPLSVADRDRFYSEGPPVARLYGVKDAPAAEAEMEALLEAMLPQLEPSEIIFDFLRIMRRAPVLPPPFGFTNRVALRAAAMLVPPEIRRVLGLGRRYNLPPGATPLLRATGSFADRVLLENSPATQACARLGLPRDFLYRR